MANGSESRRGILVLLGLALVCLVLSGCRKEEIKVDVEEAAPPAGQKAAAPAQPTSTVQADPAWFACKSDSDCLAVEGVCSEFSAVNFNHVKAYEQYRNEIRAQVECMTLEPSPTVPQVRCIEQRCSLEEGQ